MIGMGIWRIVRVLLWCCLTCQKPLTRYLTVPSAFHSAPVSTRRILYLALERPILEYGSTTWHLLNKTLTKRLEPFQRFAWRVVLQSLKTTHEQWWRSSFQVGPSFIVTVQTSWHRYPLSSIQNCPWFVVTSKSLSSLITVLISGTSTPVPWIHLCAVWLCTTDLFIHMPLIYALELPPGGKFQVKVFVFLQDGCSFPSRVITICLILSCLVLFSCHLPCCFLVNFLSATFYVLFGVFGHPFNLLFINIGFCLASSRML